MTQGRYGVSPDDIVCGVREASGKETADRIMKLLMQRHANGEKELFE
jgi:hypothetical protein